MERTCSQDILEGLLWNKGPYYGCPGGREKDTIGLTFLSNRPQDVEDFRIAIAIEIIQYRA